MSIATNTHCGEYDETTKYLRLTRILSGPSPGGGQRSRYVFKS